MHNKSLEESGSFSHHLKVVTLLKNTYISTKIFFFFFLKLASYDLFSNMTLVVHNESMSHSQCQLTSTGIQLVSFLLVH